jgi:pSer/pThr/pTyr-binding forkhead associated (FHA) protein
MSFRRDSIFEPMQEHGTTTVEFPTPSQSLPSGWLDEARAELPGEGRYLVRRNDDTVQVFRIEEGWTRIGRSVAADIRLDHPSVSRRHALIISEPDTSLRVLDDRSLNGVLVNGEEIEWGKLEDGDELRIGRFQLFALEA